MGVPELEDVAEVGVTARAGAEAELDKSNEFALERGCGGITAGRGGDVRVSAVPCNMVLSETVKLGDDPSGPAARGPCDGTIGGGELEMGTLLPYVYCCDC